MERYRRGKTHRARTGSVNVLSGAPFGYQYLRKTDQAGAVYQVNEAEAALVAEMFRRYADQGATIADLARWLTAQGVPTRTGKHRWDRSVVWGMLRNPAYAGTAVFGKTLAIHEPAGLNRVARLQGRSVPRAIKTVDRPREEWTGIPVPALVEEDTFARVQRRLEDNKRFASRNTKVPSLLQGLAACASCGYGYYRTSTTTTSGKKIYYYRCLGSDDYRYQGGRVCGNKPVRADYVDQVVRDHVTALLAAPALIRAEISRRLERARTSDPVTRKRGQLEQALAKTTTSIGAMITAFSEQLITIDELRTRMPGLRAREAGLKDQIAALDAQAAGRDAYLKLAGDLEGFLARLRTSSATATTQDRQRVLRAVVQDILIGPEKLTIRHRIPVREPSSGGGHHDTTDTEGDMRESSLLRWGRDHPALGGSLPGRGEPAVFDHARRQPPGDQLPGRERAELAEEMVVVDPVECRCQVRVEHPHPARARAVAALACLEDGLDRVMAATAGPEAIRPRLEPCLPLGFRRTGHARLLRAVRDHRDTEGPLLPAGLRDIHPPDRTGRPRFGLVLQPPGQVSPVLRGQHYLPVDTRRRAASINLRHPPHADQRVRPGPEHQLLQVADPLEVPRLRRREDPLPQPPYVLLRQEPAHALPAARPVLRSVHHRGTGRRSLRHASRPRRSGVQLALRFQRRCHRHPSRAHLTRVSALSGRGISPVSGQLSGSAGGGASHRCPGFLLPFGRRH